MSAPAPERPKPTRRTLALIVGPILAIVAVGYVGNAIHPTLLNNHPLWLVAMEPRNRYLLLVADKVDFVPFLLVATLRRMASDPLFYLLGYLYGDSGVRWMEKRFGDSGGLVRATERGFAKAAPALVFFFPGLIVCVLAGATGMSPVVFAALNVAGTVTMVTALYHLADFLDPVLDPVNNFYRDNGKVLTVLAIVLTVWWLWDQRRRGKSELQGISTIEKELEDERDPDTTT